MKLSKSESINRALSNMGIFSYVDIVNYLPRKYEDYTPTNKKHFEHKERVVLVGKIVNIPTTSRFNRNSVTKFSFLTTNNNLWNCEAWNRPYLSKSLNMDETYTIVGLFDAIKNKINIVNIASGKVDENAAIKPIYSLPKQIKNYQFTNYVKKAFSLINKDSIVDDIPTYLKNKYRLLDKFDALKLIHFGKSIEEIYQGLRVLKYEECLSFSLKTLLIRKQNKELIKNINQHIDKQNIEEYIAKLPFSLTSDQRKVFEEILHDMNDRSLMYRLLQGDVGTGKTLVAALALFANHLRNDQSAFMAPTDTLARQHFKTMCELFKDTNMKIALLLGSTSLKERAAIRNGLINKKIDLVVGTHVLFSKDINYLSLGLAIIDEQHKFGVNQRMMLASKGARADLLLMSATPIPRTLALTLYGDLDVSTLNEFPFSKRDVETILIKPKFSLIRKYIDSSLSNNKKVFIVAPLIDDDEEKRISVEKVYASFLLKYPCKVSLLHGKMDIDEKQFAINDFINGKTSILISTSVIEVGVDVKDADLMVVYEPSSFGLASLHQLRGRIGRDGTHASCLLVDDTTTQEAKDKINILVNSNDGFYIAEQDLKRRGPGELMGSKQSGIANFTFVNLVKDFKMFELARDDAYFIIQNKDQSDFKKLIDKHLKEIANTKYANS